MTDKLTDLKLDQQNPRRHDERNLKVIGASLKATGPARSIVIDEDDNILAGNGVTEAARAAGIEKVIVIEAEDDALIAVRKRGLTPEQKTALKYYDNRAAELAAWEPEQILADLDSGLDLGQFWSEGELNAILAGLQPEPKQDPGPQVDKAEQLQEKWQVKAGDVWQLGRHRLICGDCRDIETVKAVCDGRQVNGVFTSPPYAEQRKKQYGGVPTTEYVEWWEAVQGNVREVLAGDGSFFVNIKPHCEDGQRVLYVFDLVLAMVRRWGWRFVDELYWKRRAYPGDFKQRFRNEIEPVFHFSLKVCKFKPNNVLIKSSVANGHSPARSDFASLGTSLPQIDFSGDWARPTNVIDVSESEREIPHEASFPLALPTFFIKAYSDPDDIWLDPFAGSGTTLIACENEGRIGRGIEILPKYCSVILQRWADLTGQEPALL